MWGERGPGLDLANPRGDGLDLRRGLTDFCSRSVGLGGGGDLVEGRLGVVDRCQQVLMDARHRIDEVFASKFSHISLIIALSCTKVFGCIFFKCFIDHIP